MNFREGCLRVEWTVVFNPSPFLPVTLRVVSQTGSYPSFFFPFGVSLFFFTYIFFLIFFYDR